MDAAGLGELKRSRHEPGKSLNEIYLAYNDRHG